MTQHTPGPWTCFYKHKYDEWHVSLPVAGSSMRIALCPDGIQSNNREADARLIAAAPALYEALNDLLELCLHNGDFKNGVTHNCIDEGEVCAGQYFDKARAALLLVRSYGNSEAK